MRIELVSEHASPLAAIGGVDAGGQNVHVAALAAGLAQRGNEVTVYTRRDDESLPERVVTQDGYDVDHVIATCSDEVFELRRLGLPSDRVSVVPCGVDTSVFTPRGPVAPRTERKRLLVLGRLVERKGQDDAVRALRAVPDA